MAANITVSSIDVQNCQYSGTTIELRIWPDQSFIAADGTAIQAPEDTASPRSFYKTVSCSLASGTLTIAEFDIHSTTDANENQSARYWAYFYVDGVQRDRFLPDSLQNGFYVRPTYSIGTTTTWALIETDNNPTRRIRDDNRTYTQDQINTLLNTAVSVGNAATTSSIGRVQLSAEPTDALAPVVITDTDERVKLVVNPKAQPYNAQGDGKVRTDCSMTSGSATLTCATSVFTAADEGKVIAVYGAGPLSNGYRQPLSTTILDYVSPTQVTLATTASVSVTNSERTVWGTDDTAALQAAVDALTASDGNGGNIGGTLQIPAGVYLTKGLLLNCAKVGTWIQGTCTKTYNNITIAGAGRGATVLENWDITVTYSSHPGLIALGYHGNPSSLEPGNDRVRNITIHDLTCRQVKNASSPLKALASFASTYVHIFNCEFINPSYEGLYMGGGNKSRYWYVHHNIASGSGLSGPAYTQSTSALNLNGADWLAEFNDVTGSGQAVEMGAIRGVLRNNRLDGTGMTVNPPIGVNIGSSNSGVMDNAIENNLIIAYTSGVQVDNSIGTAHSTIIRGNQFWNVRAPVLIRSGLETISVAEDGHTDTVIHGTSIVQGNTARATGTNIINFLTAGENLSPQKGLESIIAQDNIISLSTTSPSNSNVLVIAGPYGGGSKWLPSTAYASGALAVPQINNNLYYRVTTAGTSGTAEPTWPTTVGATVTDGTVVWTCKGPRATVHWINNRLTAPMGTVGSNNEISFRNNTSRQVLKVVDFSVSFPWRVEAGAFDETGIPADSFYSERDRYNDSAPTAGYYTLGVKINKKTVTSGAGGQGWIATRAGYAAVAYSAASSYSTFGTLVVPTVDNGHFYMLISGSAGATAEPVWPTGSGATVVNGGATWKESGASVLFTAVP